MSHDSLHDVAETLAKRLRDTNQRLVLTESCTGGLAAAALTCIPGISEYFCGSAVVYRNATKSAWLGVSAEQLDDPTVGPVSSQTAGDLARGALSRTDEADLAASITGHLGPCAPDGLDGVVYVGIARRDDAGPVTVEVQRHILDRPGETPEDIRRLRQRSAACQLLDDINRHLSEQAT